MKWPLLPHLLLLIFPPSLGKPCQAQPFYWLFPLSRMLFTHIYMQFTSLISFKSLLKSHFLREAFPDHDRYMVGPQNTCWTNEWVPTVCQAPPWAYLHVLPHLILKTILTEKYYDICFYNWEKRNSDNHTRMSHSWEAIVQMWAPIGPNSKLYSSHYSECSDTRFDLIRITKWLAQRTCPTVSFQTYPSQLKKIILRKRCRVWVR